MQLSLTGHHVDITPPLRDYVGTKIKRLAKHFDNLVDVHVVLTVAKLEHRAEATIQLSGAKVHADDVQENMYAAIDGLVDKLDRQLVKHKGKLTGRRTEGVDRWAGVDSVTDADSELE